MVSGGKHVRVYYRFEEPDEFPAEQEIEVAPVSPPIESIFAPDRKKPGFWRRQFGEEVTEAQKRADWIFGVVLPLVCFYFDPFIFRGWGAGPMLPAFRLPVYIVSFMSVMTLAAWLLWGNKLGHFRAAAAYVMIAGALMASILGLVLFPFSLVGLLAIIGVLGFTPICTAVIYWRNAVRAFRSSTK